MFATKKLNQIYLPHSISSILKRNYRIKVERNCYYYPHQIANALQQIWCTPFEKSVRNGFSGKSDILCIDCEYNKDLYISRGLDARKIRVIGGGFFDYSYKSFFRKRECQRKVYLKNINLTMKVK